MINNLRVKYLEPLFNFPRQLDLTQKPDDPAHVSYTGDEHVSSPCVRHGSKYYYRPEYYDLKIVKHVWRYWVNLNRRG